MNWLLIAWIAFIALDINIWRWLRNEYDKSPLYLYNIFGLFVLGFVTVFAPLYEKVEDVTNQVQRTSFFFNDLYYQVVDYKGKHAVFTYHIKPERKNELDNYPVKWVTSHSAVGIKENPKLQLRK